MRFRVVAADYDGTLANDGRVDKRTVETLVRVRASGRKVILITGRELDSLQSVFPELGLFDLIAAENGALLYYPSTGEEKLLGSTPPATFVEMLRTLRGESSFGWPLRCGNRETLRSRGCQGDRRARTRPASYLKPGVGHGPSSRSR